ncbi:MAG: YdcF family protein [Chloroflexi bacterium]|nr:YdcF family protein [Chloroflexota bacterium]
MFIFLSKFLPLFVYPIGLTTLLIGAGLCFWKNPRVAKTLLTIAFLILFVCGNRYVSTTFTRSLEWKYKPPTSLPKADVIVVLGGGTEPLLDPRPMVEVNAAGDRVIYTAKVFTQQPDIKILLSGGNIEFLDQGASSPANDMYELLSFMGVPESSMILQGKSQNTYEDALYSCEMIKAQGFKKIILITSAMHMPRSVLLFEKQGCEVIPAPTDYSITTNSWERLWHPSIEEFVINLIPSYSNLSEITKAMKEYLGMFTYRLKGWI